METLFQGGKKGAKYLPEEVWKEMRVFFAFLFE